MTGMISRRRFLQGTGAALGLVAAGEVGSRNSGEEPPRDGSNVSRATPGRSGLNRSGPETQKWLEIAGSGEQVSIDHSRVLPPTVSSTRTRTRTAPPTETETDTATATATPAPTLTRDEYLLLAGSQYETPVYEIDAPRSGPTTMVVGGMHGDERSGYLAAEHVARWGVKRGRLVVVPHANVPAITRERRHGLNGDLNRAFPCAADSEPTTPLARGLWAVVEDQDPDHLLDLHSSRGIWDGREGGDSGVGQAVFPTDVRPAVRHATETVQALNRSLGLEGDLAYRPGNLLDGDRPMLAHRFGELLGRPAFIAETVEGVPMDHQVSWQLFVVDYLLYLFGQHAIIR